MQRNLSLLVEVQIDINLHEFTFGERFIIALVISNIIVDVTLQFLFHVCRADGNQFVLGKNYIVLSSTQFT